MTTAARAARCYWLGHHVPNRAVPLDLLRLCMDEVLTATRANDEWNSTSRCSTGVPRVGASRLGTCVPTCSPGGSNDPLGESERWQLGTVRQHGPQARSVLTSRVRAITRAITPGDPRRVAVNAGHSAG